MDIKAHLEEVKADAARITEERVAQQKASIEASKAQDKAEAKAPKVKKESK
jgi:hypothetical protein